MTDEQRETAASPGTTVVLFGPQMLSFNKKSFDKLRALLLGETSLHWIQETVAELPHLWNNITQSFPKLNSLPGETLVSDLNRWLKNGVEQSQGDIRLPNIVLTPLVVITQLTQYWRYLQLDPKGVAGARDLHSSFIQRDVETLGFCTGLLGAFAVSCSFNEHDLRKYGAVAIRLAMLIGAFVDVQDASDDAYGHAKSYALRWISDEQNAEMEQILDRFPEAYISVQYDERRATLTTSERTAPALLEQLKAAGISATEVGLQGRFHSAHYKDDIDALVQFCDSNSKFRFSDGTDLALPSYTNNGGGTVRRGKMHELALRGILVEQSKWYQTLAFVQASKLNSEGSFTISIGPDKFVPPTIMRRLGPRLIHIAGSDGDTTNVSDLVARSGSAQAAVDNDIAIVGVSIKVAGADDTNEFWEILSKGQSQHQEVPESRMGFETHWREVDAERKWYGNFLNDVDGFDHKFFKKSPQEAASMDPQQRLMLQAAYQAVEQSGYFSLPKVDAHVGCYVGACAVDYEHNIASHPPNAFSATGSLRSFLAGNISHYFGWTGPGITIDTACSSSAVAIHMGCKAILGGECNAALAGGVATISNPLWFQNLAGASFLSPTGQCKPFDELADGYCRGEGVACVFLKKMSTAIADGNHIFGCIPSTAVYQSQNCTPIFVPNSPSLSPLFGDVIRQAHLGPEQISLVEAHGTGTPAGDLAEFESIHLALAGPDIRKEPLPIGSVKGLIGHTEGASGVISLIKVLLMMQEGYIPPQASFTKISHHINPSTSDMEVVTSLKPWTERFKAALVNSYGASGSNASMIVTQPPRNSQKSAGIHAAGLKYPFWISALDERSVAEYCAKLLKYIKTEKVSFKTATLADLSFNVCRQSNRSFSRGPVFSCGSITELQDKLTSPPIVVKPTRSVILCFGGLASTFVGLDRSVYENIHILRSHLNECDKFIQSLGLDSIYPGIFQRTPIEDTVKLQAILFSMQYSCAKSWMDCGVKVDAVVGHNFGEITALCISGVLSLRDTIKMVIGRAKVVRDMWGEDHGAMIAVEGDLSTVSQLLTEANKRYDGEYQANIASHNGPRSFALAGSTEAICIIEEIAQTSFSSLKCKRLNVPNAFHSSLVEPLMDSLEQVGRSLTFNKPAIRLERATESSTSSHEITYRFLADHMRNPVFFNQAVHRLAKDYTSSIWLEAGSGSTITTMANRALGSSETQYFQAINLANDQGFGSLTDATVSLWKEGLRVSFWAHHPLQTRDYQPLLLPPYQFEASHHWLELKSPGKDVLLPESRTRDIALGLSKFVGYKDAANRSAATIPSNHAVAQLVPREKGAKVSRPDISEDVRNIIANVSGLAASDIKNDSELADFGIYPLMRMELALEVERVFGCALNQGQLTEANSFRKLVKCVRSALYWADDDTRVDDDSASASELSDFGTPEDTCDETTTTTSSPPTERVTGRELTLSRYDILASFGESKMLTDKLVRDYKIDNFSSVIFAESNRLCVALVVETFEQLGCPLRTATKGQVLERISYKPQQRRLVEYLYEFLETEARLIDIRGSQITRTGIAAPKNSSDTILERLLKDHPEWRIAHQLTHYAGKNLKDVLIGKKDGTRLLYRSTEGRKLVSRLFCDHPINKMGFEQMKDFIGRLVSRHPTSEGPLKILEMGAGTGGATQVLAPYLATLNVPVEYTFTDLSASTVAQARLKYGKIYPFMKFAVHDIEKPPSLELRDQHIVVASNAVHATHNLPVSAGHIHSTLRPDGFLLMLEMTQIIPHIELIFGLSESWWLFDDGRRHAISDPSRWEQSLKSVGFGHVDYSDGSLPETDVQKVIIALASGPTMERLPKPEQISVKKSVEARESDSEKYVAKYSKGFNEPHPLRTLRTSRKTSGSVILITGTTGSLGSYLVEELSLRSDVEKVVCLNRRKNKPAEERQQEAFLSRGIHLPAEAQAKLWVFDTNAAKPNLGLPESEYIWLVENVSHIIHNAWLMSGTRPIEAFEPHFQTLRNLIDLTHAIASRRSSSSFRVSFQFVSSIGVVGHYPLWSGEALVPEERMQMKSTLDNGYCEAKLTCEHILDKTLHKYPEYFRPMAVRLGQVAGSRTSGYWNQFEHLSFLIKSSQTLRALPAFEGVLHWTPVNDVAKTLVDLSLSDSASHPIYHIDNPVGQPWPEMVKVLADALDIPRRNIVPFQEWIKRVRRSPLSAETDNPATLLINFLDDNFLRMACGGIILDTSKTRDDSETLAVQGPVSMEIARKYVQAWKDTGFLQS